MPPRIPGAAGEATTFVVLAALAAFLLRAGAGARASAGDSKPR
jgi:hypothetical protein